MNPVAINLFGIKIMWYGIFIAIGVLVAILFSYFILKKENNFNEDYFLNGIMITFLVGFIGARLWFVLFSLSAFNNLWDIINTRNGGLAFHGGIIFGVIAFVLYARIKKIDIPRYLDIVSISVLFAQGLGRWGNFFNQEAHGGPVSESFISHFPIFIQNGMLINYVYYHPTFLYESINNLIWFAVLAFLILKKVNFEKGTFFALAIFGNSLGRFFIEGLRTDSLMLGSLRVAQIVSFICIVFSLLYIAYLYFIVSKHRKNNYY